ncbi:hypothetical protein RB614_25805 [Phytohabitans sp. ZYX-F-186]|uniref:DUF306 domain-containing protein n=1 Tax=Phytohabitans maris TaxID=3071409 RepID=A0ABU0ZLR0_9ACTN|nr:hypothetical protein [Phytohabitans sp. ZYX-F-186]MDQ7907945.1 hypothetical protein [Phytohabitans sp. ZYX-F-186]
MTAPDPQYPVPRPPAGPAYPPFSAPPDQMSAPPLSAPPAPYPVSPAAPAPAKRSRGALLAVGVSTLALLVAVVSLAVAWRAVDQAGDAKRFALAGAADVPAPVTQAPAPPATTGAPPPTEAPATDAPIAPDPTSTAEPAPLDERTVYTVEYEKQVLTLKAGCNDSMYIDLDEPRANVEYNDYDLGFTRRCQGGTSNLGLGEGVEGSESGNPQMTPHDCAERIRTAPIGTDAAVPVRKGVVLCLTTSLASARAKGDSQRMVRLEITGAADDGTVTLQGTAWNIPR